MPWSPGGFRVCPFSLIAIALGSACSSSAHLLARPAPFGWTECGSRAAAWRGALVFFPLALVVACCVASDHEGAWSHLLLYLGLVGLGRSDPFLLLWFPVLRR